MSRKQNRYVPPAEGESGVSYAEIVTYKAVYLLSWTGEMRNSAKGKLTCVKGEAEGQCGNVRAWFVFQEAVNNNVLEIVPIKNGMNCGMWRSSRILSCTALPKGEDLRAPRPEPATVSPLPVTTYMASMAPAPEPAMMAHAFAEQQTLQSPLYISEDLRNERQAQRMARESDACMRHRVSQPDCPDCL